MTKKTTWLTIKKVATLKKSEKNPIIAPKKKNKWEACQTFNPAVIFLNNKVHILYRAIGKNKVSKLGYALSSDGFKIEERLPLPVYKHKISKLGGSEDPRIVQVNNEDTLYMTYTANSNGLRMALTSIKVKDFLEKKWKWSVPKLISPPGEITKNWIIFPKKIKGKYAIITSISPKILISYRKSLKFKKGDYLKSSYELKVYDNRWIKKGVGSVPIETKDGWLVFYHALDVCDLNKVNKYKVLAMVLDFHNPTKILYSSKESILESTEVYEDNGFKPGIVYATGAIVRNNTLLIYYGAADNYIGVAYVNIDEFLQKIKIGVKPRFQKKIIKK